MKKVICCFIFIFFVVCGADAFEFKGVNIESIFSFNYYAAKKEQKNEINNSPTAIVKTTSEKESKKLVPAPKVDSHSVSDDCDKGYKNLHRSKPFILFSLCDGSKVLLYKKKLTGIEANSKLFSFNTRRLFGSHKWQWLTPNRIVLIEPIIQKSLKEPVRVCISSKDPTDNICVILNPSDGTLSTVLRKLTERHYSFFYTEA